LRQLDKSGNCFCQGKVPVGSGIKVMDDRFVNKSWYFMLWFYHTGVLVTKLGRGVAAGAIRMPTCFQCGVLSSEVAWWQKGLQDEESDLSSLSRFSQWLAIENFLLMGTVIMEDRGQHVRFLIVTLAAATVIWKERFQICSRRMSRRWL